MNRKNASKLWKIIHEAGWRIKKTWVDDKKLFSVHCLDLNKLG